MSLLTKKQEKEISEYLVINNKCEILVCFSPYYFFIYSYMCM